MFGCMCRISYMCSIMCKLLCANVIALGASSDGDARRINASQQAIRRAFRCLRRWWWVDHVCGCQRSRVPVVDHKQTNSDTLELWAELPFIWFGANARTHQRRRLTPYFCGPLFIVRNILIEIQVTWTMPNINQFYFRPFFPFRRLFFFLFYFFAGWRLCSAIAPRTSRAQKMQRKGEKHIKWKLENAIIRAMVFVVVSIFNFLRRLSKQLEWSVDSSFAGGS